MLFPVQAIADQDPVELTITAQVGPWTCATKPIGYRGRLWFANANRWPDHNSADIWSMAADGSDLRMERRLFSQDVGVPAIHGVHLYWPMEDPRVSLGWGQIAVTNGTDWTVQETRVGRQFHLHALTTSETPDLLAAGSSWNAQILQSMDRGRTWSIVWERAREEKRFSRTYNVASTRFGLVSDLMIFGQGPNSFGMLRHNAGVATAIPGWPTDSIVERTFASDYGVYGLVRNPGTGTRKLLEIVLDKNTPGVGRVREIALPEGPRPLDLDLDLDLDGFTLLTGKDDDGRHMIWQRDSNEHWRMIGYLEGDEPQEINLIWGQPVVTGSHQGRGAVWGLPGPVPGPCGQFVGAVANGDYLKCMDQNIPAILRELPTQIEAGDVDTDEARRQIAEALNDPRSYVGHGIRLRNVVDKWVMRGLGGDVLSQYLTGSFPKGEVKLIGGRAFASHERFGRWILMWGMRRAGGGSVPLPWLRHAFQEPVNGSAKYFSEPVAAGWTAAAIGQDDDATMSAMLARAINRDQPEWLRIDYEANFRVLDRQ